jgi:uncharacterized OB-fold protein
MSAPMTERTPPVPKNEHERAYQSALAGHRLALQRCAACGFVRYPPGPSCPECWSGDFEWKALSGDGRVLSVIWYMQSLDRRFPEVPYNVSLVKLAEGPALISNVLGAKFGEIAVGDAVRASYLDQHGFTALMFEKA